MRADADHLPCWLEGDFRVEEVAHFDAAAVDGWDAADGSAGWRENLEKRLKGTRFKITRRDILSKRERKTL